MRYLVLLGLGAIASFLSFAVDGVEPEPSQLEAEYARAQLLLAEIPFLLLGCLFLLVGLYHLLLFRRRRERHAYLWFGLTSIAFALNASVFSAWFEGLVPNLDLRARLGQLSVHLCAVFFIQFFWPFLEEPISRLLRFYQLSHAFLIAAVLVAPLDLVFATGLGRYLWIAPLLPFLVALIVRKAWQGQPEARTIAWGGLLLVAAVVHEMARILGYPVLTGQPLPLWGFAAFILSMAMSLSNQFHRVFAERDELRRGLESKVQERTAQLEAARLEALQASEAKSAFLANMSHEIRTPMNAVLGMTELLSHTELDELQHDYISTISSAGHGLLGLMDDLLDLSKIESGLLEIEQVSFDLEAVMGEVARLVLWQAEEKGLRLGLRYDPDLPRRVKGDSARLRQVLLNLLGNGVKFTEVGYIELAAKRGEDATLEISVQDTGIGIEPGRLEHIFELFAQAEDSLTRRFGGMGLGLSISRRLTEEMGGTLSVESEVGKGSVFRLRLPLVEGSLPETTREPAPRPGLPEDAHRILVAEDNPTNSLLLSAQLKALGQHRVDFAIDGVEALEALEKRPYSLVLLDCQMPRMDGYEVVRRLRRFKGDLAHTPVVAVTAHAMKGDRERCLAAGMDDYLPKPVTEQGLARVLEQWLPN